MTTIYLLGDIHVGAIDKFSAKRLLLDTLKTRLSLNPNALAILPGDLTENGYGYGMFLRCFPCLCINNTKSIDEAGEFISVHRDLLSVNKNVYMCIGNHDQGTDWFSYPIADYINLVHRANENGCYSFVHGGIYFICLGKYPGTFELAYFNMVHSINVADKNLPYVVFHHYNYEGPYSDFWTPAEKADAYMCYDNKNILCILHGHIHLTEQRSSLSTLPSNKSIPVFCGSGMTSFGVITINDEPGLSLRKIVTFTPDS